MEGDRMIRYSDFKNFAFQSTPSAWRETFPGIAFYQSEGISIHSLRMEGDLMALIHAIPDIVFQSTPSAWRETTFTDLERQSQGISIHSLRMEGDPQLDILDATGQHFNPLPPHGGRQKWFCIIMGDYVFQSTPSAWRETCRSQEEVPRMVYFNPLPPHGGRRQCRRNGRKNILHFNPLPPHGGRLGTVKGFCDPAEFQSTPSAWRETVLMLVKPSIRIFQSTPSAWRETRWRQKKRQRRWHFNPLPPHGGRLRTSGIRLS